MNEMKKQPHNTTGNNNNKSDFIVFPSVLTTSALDKLKADVGKLISARTRAAATADTHCVALLSADGGVLLPQPRLKRRMTVRRETRDVRMADLFSDSHGLPGPQCAPKLQGLAALHCHTHMHVELALPS